MGKKSKLFKIDFRLKLINNHFQGVIPYDIGVDPDDGFKYNSWRIFVAICGIPALLVAFALFTLPESPKYLLSKGRESEALKIFQNMYAKNTGLYASDYPVGKNSLSFIPTHCQF